MTPTTFLAQRKMCRYCKNEATEQTHAQDFEDGKHIWMSCPACSAKWHFNPVPTEAEKKSFSEWQAWRLDTSSNKRGTIGVSRGNTRLAVW
jgi:hypothetical protein